MNFPSYETYVPSKLSWLDEIPSGWDVIPIKFGLEIPITDGPHETPEILNEGIPFLSAESVKKDKLDFNRKRGFISLEEHKRFSKKYKPKRGDVYMVKSGATTGNMARVETDQEFNIWSPLAAMRPDTEMLTTDFLFFFMKSKPFFHSVELNWNYGTQQNIGMGVIANLQMALPPVAIQKKIASFLEHKTQQINRLIEKKKELIEKLEEQRIAVITQAVTKGIDESAKLEPSDVDWLGDVPEHWDIRRFKFCVALKNLKVDAKETELAYLGMENITSFTAEKIYNEDNPTVSDGIGSYFKSDDILFGKLRPYLAKALLCDEEGFCSTELLVLESQELIPEYALNVVLSDWFINVVNSSTYGAKMPRASWDFIGELRCPYPDKKEQKTIVNFININKKKLRKMITVTKEAIIKLEEYRSAIITSAVTGKIDVREIEIPEADL